ncbi:MAG: hypothetical protein KKF62_09400 [Bacteroidetes bacterium]|nr:hypothetical protein [Bacteroidota bacterium]MBU1113743.1 hypothetical protein [Bacteroidota bacterium]MBU1800232.1 hypothetical protein [Bacteroidota bacterium]
MKIFSVFCIIIGTIGAAITASHIPPLWLEFGLFLIIISIGIYLNRKNASEKYLAKSNNVNPLIEFEILINDQIDQLTGFIKNEDVMNSLLDNYKIEHLYNQIDYLKVALINQLGMGKYIAIISPCARAERLLYRGYSSATDGYYEEAKQSLTQSLVFFKMTNEEINKIKEV